MLVREAGTGDFEAISRLYAQLHPAEPAPQDREVFERILDTPGLHLLVVEYDGAVAGTTYLNVIPNLSRGGRPYAWIENVVVDASVRGTGLGRRLIEATVQRAWDEGCYKVALTTGRSDPAVHGFYRSCGFSPDTKQAYHQARPESPGSSAP